MSAVKAMRCKRKKCGNQRVQITQAARDCWQLVLKSECPLGISKGIIATAPNKIKQGKQQYVYLWKGPQKCLHSEVGYSTE